MNTKHQPRIIVYDYDAPFSLKTWWHRVRLEWGLRRRYARRIRQARTLEERASLRRTCRKRIARLHAKAGSRKPSPYLLRCIPTNEYAVGKS